VKEDLTIRVTTDLREITMNVDPIIVPSVMIVEVTDLTTIVRRMEKTGIHTEIATVRLARLVLMEIATEAMRVLRMVIIARLTATEKEVIINPHTEIVLLMVTMNAPLMATTIVRLTETMIVRRMVTTTVRMETVHRMVIMTVRRTAIALRMAITTVAMVTNNVRLTVRRDLISTTDRPDQCLIRLREQKVMQRQTA
jgi:hypothetical protein